MRKYRVLTGAIVLSLVLIWAKVNQADLNKSEQLSKIIFQNLQAIHYNKLKVDDPFSKMVFREYLDYLDYNRQFFLKSDIEEFSSFADKLDDEFKDGDTRFMQLATERLQARINQIQQFYPQLLTEPFDFSVDEPLELDGKKRDYCSNQDELKELWRKILKNQTLIHYINLLDEKSDKPQNKTELQKKSQQAVLKNYENIFNRIKQTNEKDALSGYFNSILSIYDPHSNYLSPIDRDNFNLEMSGTFQGIGALLREEDGYVKVVEVIVGGPSWKQKELQAEDIILKVGQNNDEPIDIVGMRVIDAVKLIRGPKNTLVKLTVKKSDGRIIVIPIVRDIVVVEETFAKSALITLKSEGRTFGYITMPKFYNDFSDQKGRNITQDLEKEVKQFINNKVDGIILDLRNNSGGSLQDAIRSSGLFIEKGPIVQTKNRHSGIRILEDPDKNILYPGPLIVLTNGLSASAAEIFTAALQDYNRAVIIGTSHSFGKGTVQIVINLDEQFKMTDPDKNEELGALKVTIQKFYRITGSSMQFRGVIPDIIIPDISDYAKIGERYLDNALAWDTIEPAKFEGWTHNTNRLKTLIDRSQKRNKGNPIFKMISDHVNWIKKYRAQTKVNLRLKTMIQEQKELKESSQKIDKAIQPFTHFTINPINTNSDPANDLSKRRDQEWIKQLQKDIFINEALAVLSDWMKLKSTEH